MSFKNPQSVFESISLENLFKMGQQEGIELTNKIKKSEVINMLTEQCETIGIKQVTSALTIDQV